MIGPSGQRGSRRPVFLPCGGLAARQYEWKNDDKKFRELARLERKLFAGVDACVEPEPQVGGTKKR